MTRVLLVDNYDSFTYNLAQYLGEAGAEVIVRRNDRIDLKEAIDLRPDRLVISPGPGVPAQAGVSKDFVRHFGDHEIPVLGVCLGHQSIAEVYGAKVALAPRMMHGKTSPIHHDGRALFRDLPNPFVATRYHSLIVPEDSVPDILEISARTAEGEIMGLRHRTLPVEGVQFHPESILTPEGRAFIARFLQ